MAEFYAETEGNRGRATRCGTKDSGIEANAQTWGNIVNVRQFMDGGTQSGHGTTISLTDKNCNQALFVRFDGDTVARFKDDPEVKDALQEVRDAFDTLDIVAQRVAEERE